MIQSKKSMESRNRVWEASSPSRLARVLTEIDDLQTMKNFLRDVMTESEIIEIAARLKAAQMLANKRKYTDIIVATELSSRTVARISDWLQNGCSGYRSALKTLSQASHHHISSERLG